MSVAWSAIKPAIRDTIAELVELSPAQVIWQDEPKGTTFAAPPTIYLRIRGFEDVGFQDEIRTQVTATADTDVVVAQQKTFILSVRCESFNQDIASPKHAGVILSTMRTRLRRSSSVFDRAGVFCVWDYGKVNWFDYKDQEGRQVSCYVLDMKCATVDNDIDTTPGAGGWIEEVQGTGTVDSVSVGEDIKT